MKTDFLQKFPFPDIVAVSISLYSLGGVWWLLSPIGSFYTVEGFIGYVLFFILGAGIVLPTFLAVRYWFREPISNQNDGGRREEVPEVELKPLKIQPGDEEKPSSEVYVKREVVEPW